MSDVGDWVMVVVAEFGGCVIRLWRYGILISWSSGCIFKLGSEFMVSYWLFDTGSIWSRGRRRFLLCIES